MTDQPTLPGWKQPVRQARRFITCPVAACPNERRRTDLMCRSHWRTLPQPLRDDLWAAYRGAGIFSDEYMLAREACIAFHEGRPARTLEQLAQDGDA